MRNLVLRVFLTGLAAAGTLFLLNAARAAPSPRPTLQSTDCEITITTVLANKNVREKIYRPKVPNRQECERLGALHRSNVTPGIAEKKVTVRWSGK